jgi:hypothetical protein
MYQKGHMVRGSISTGGAKKDPLCHCCQRGRKLIREEISKRKRLPSMPKGEIVGHIVIDVNSRCHYDVMMSCYEQHAEESTYQERKCIRFHEIRQKHHGIEFPIDQ